MVDLSHQWAGDLIVSSSGDIGVCDGTAKTTQRVYRRLLTNPGDYLWNLSYGAGLASYVGSPMDDQAVESVIRNQLELEPTVASAPAPVVATQVTDAANGFVMVSIGYAAADSGFVNQLSLKLPQ